MRRKPMSRCNVGVCLTAALVLTVPAFSKSDDPGSSDGVKFQPFRPESVSSNGSVTIGGQAITYQAIAGTLVVHPKDWDDVPRDPKPDKGSGAGEDGDAKNPAAEASMFYVAYFKTGGAGSRPVTFIYT